jgi:ankyrin repeat protein
MAAARGDSVLFNDLIQSPFVDINAGDNFVGPALCIASYAGHSEIVETLLKKGAKIDVRDNQGATPLMNAVAGQQQEIVSILLKNGANLDLVLLDQNGSETAATALTIAQMKGYSHIEQLIAEEANKRDKRRHD